MRGRSGVRGLHVCASIPHIGWRVDYNLVSAIEYMHVGHEIGLYCGESTGGSIRAQDNGPGANRGIEIPSMWL